MKSHPALIVFGSMVVSLLLACASLPAAAQPHAQPGDGNTPCDQQHPGPTIRVQATGEVEVAPDLATIDIAVETQADEAREATAENARRTEKLLEALLNMEVPEDAVETRHFSVQPVYRRHRSDAPPEIEGYKAVNMLLVRLDDLGRVGAVIDGAIEAGADRVARLQFELSDPLSARREALATAIGNARSDAQAIASALDVDLGPVLDASTIDHQPSFPVVRMAVQADARPETPITPGPQTVTATVRLVYSVND